MSRVVVTLALAAWPALVTVPTTASEPPTWSHPMAIGPSDATSLAVRPGLLLAGGRLHTKDSGTTESVRPSPRRAGVFRSLDRGAAWERGVELLPDANGELKPVPIDRAPELVAAPLTGSRAYATFGTEVWRSDDNAYSWTRVGTLPSAPTTLGFLADGAVVAGLAAGGLRRSADAGATWTSLGTGLPAARVNEVVAYNAIVVVATDSGVYRSTDTGQTFTASSTGLPPGGGPVLGLAKTPDELWIAMNPPSTFTGSALYASGDDGGVWRFQGTLGSQQNIVPVVQRGALVYAHHTPTPHIYAGTQIGIFRGVRGSGAPWERIEPIPGMRLVRELAVEDTDPHPTARADLIYSAVKRGSVGVATKTTSKLTAPGWFDELDGGRICAGLVVHKPSGDLVAACGRHIFRSKDAGATWSDASKGLPYSNGGVDLASLAYVPFAQSADGSLWTSGFHIGLWKSTPDIGSWSRTLLPTPSVGPIATHPTEPGTAYVASLATNGSLNYILWRTTDGGLTWTSIFTTDATDQVYSIDTTPLVPNRVFLVVNGQGAFVSEDRGDTWVAASGLPATGGMSLQRGALSEAARDDAWATVVQDGSPTRWLVYRSTDGARTWFQAGQAPSGETNIIPSPWDRDTVYMDNARDGVIVSRQAGATGSWSPLAAGLIGPTDPIGLTDNLTFHPTQRGVFFATDGVGTVGAPPYSLWVASGRDPVVQPTG